MMPANSVKVLRIEAIAVSPRYISKSESEDFRGLNVDDSCLSPTTKILGEQTIELGLSKATTRSSYPNPEMGAGLVCAVSPIQ